MRFEIIATPLAGNRTMTLYRFLVDGAEYLRQVSAIGAYDVTKRLEDAGKAHLVDEALHQLGMVPWGRDLAPTTIVRGRGAEVAPRGPGRPAKDQYANYREELPAHIPVEQLVGAVPDLAP
jgi:hypothetical protein